MKKSSRKIEWKGAPDVKRKLTHLLKSLQIDYIKGSRIFTYRSVNSKTRAYARIWGLSGLWQRTLKVGPAYILEVLSEHYDNLSEVEKDKVILHELTHIPKNFSGALLPHIRRGKRSFHRKLDTLIDLYFASKRI
ncbi:MAG: putative metallopeptidase [Microgenomates group bacterium]